MPYIETRDGTALYVHVSGPSEGVPLLLVHGWPLNHRIFDAQLARLPALGYRCIAPDLRGFGRSDAAWNSYSHDQTADDLDDIRQSLRLGRFLLAGFSTGGGAAIRYAVRHGKQKLDGLALVSAAVSLAKSAEWPHGLNAAQTKDLIDKAKADRPAMVTGYAKQMFYRYHSPEFMSWFASLGLEASLAGTVSGAEAALAEDLSGELKRLAGLPSAVFYGVHDRIVSRAASEQLAAALPGATAYRFEKSGHGLLFDEAELFQRRLEEFLAAVRPQA